MKRWEYILLKGAEIVQSYDTGVTLRQLFYRLVSIGLLKNTRSEYTALSQRTAEARRSGTFPALIDRTRRIHRPLTFAGADDARKWLSRIYQRDRQEGQAVKVYLGVEKNGIVEQLSAWFGEPYGIPILALGGYSSQTYADDISEDMEEDERESVLIYAGDFDPSGMDILRDFVGRCPFDHIERIALNEEQVKQYRLPENYGKASDTRAAGFVREYGRLCQVELDALDPSDLRGLYAGAIARHVDTSRVQASIERERAERLSLLDGLR